MSIKLSYRLKSLLLLLSLCYLVSHPVSAQSNTEHVFFPLRIEQDFDIEATLNEAVWEQAPSVFIRHEIMPNDQAPAPVKTEVKVLYSTDYLYIGFIATDPQPAEIRAHIADRDNSFQDDYVGVIVDPFNNNQKAYELFINPLGIQMDGMRTGNSEDMNFDMLWYSEGRITDSGFVAVMKIPFKSLNFPQRELHTWSVQFFRNYPRNQRHQLVWTDVSIDNSCLLCQNGKMAGLKRIENSDTIELLPYAMGFQRSTMAEAGQPASGLEHGSLEGRAGGSISYAPSSAVSLVAVVNPDFSQVETDAVQISANETFALYYPEKRPFFMKGADLFSTQEEVFYSRMINHPLAAGKFTRQTGAYSLAFMTVYDRSAPFIVPGLGGSSLIRSDREAYSNILRAKFHLGSQSFVGGLLTTRNQAEGSNYVGSVDWNLLLAENYYFNGQLAFSDTQELDDLVLFDETRTFGQSGYDAAFNGEHYSGSLLNAEFSRQAKYYNFSLGYSSYSPTFQSHSGFINRTDRRQFRAEQSLSYYPQSRWISRGSISLSGTWRYDFGGRFYERFIFIRTHNMFAGQTQLSVNFLPLNDERFRGEFFTGLHRVMIGLSSNAMDVLSLGLDFDFGRYVYRAEDPSMGRGYNASISATIEPTARLQLAADYNYSALSSLDRSETYFSGSVIRLNTRYNFSRKFFARVITQYDSFGEELQVYPLLYYQVNPFTKFYLGMTNYMTRYSESDIFQGLWQTDRQFFVKFQYLIRS